MQEFVAKKLSSMIGYATPSNRYYEFNIAAAAEWSWSVKGRSLGEFAEAYAVRRGIPQPGRFAEWAQRIGEIGWKLAGSRSVEKLIFGAGGQAFINGQIQPGDFLKTLENLKFGGDLFAEFVDEKDFRETIVQARLALRTAQEIGDSQVMCESESVLNLMEFLASLKELAGLWQSSGQPDKDRLGTALQKMDIAAKRLTAAGYRWGMLVNPRPRTLLASRFRDSVDFAASAADQEWRLAVQTGAADPQPGYRRRPVIEWTEKDFASAETVSLWADVTDLLSGAGEYDVILQFLEGTAGVGTRAVSLLRGETREKAEVIDEDRWDFSIGRWNNYVDYWLTISSEKEAAAQKADRYFLKVELAGPALSLPSERRATRGFAALRRSWRR
jgi:hypothetical protein